jgi:hypothetical protein
MNDQRLRHDAPATGGTGLKVLVIVMGVMIVAGLAVLGFTIIGRATDTDMVRASDYATAAVALPAGSRALAMAGEGDAVTLLVEARGGQSLVTIDRRTGAVLGTLTLEAP